MVTRNLTCAGRVLQIRPNVLKRTLKKTFKNRLQTGSRIIQANFIVKENNMFVVANRVYVTPEWAEKFEERFRHRAGQIEKQAGFVRLEILRPLTENSPYVVLTTWQNQQAFKNWVGSEDFKSAHQNPLPKEAFSRESQFEQHEVIISAGDTNQPSDH